MTKKSFSKLHKIIVILSGEKKRKKLNIYFGRIVTCTESNPHVHNPLFQKGIIYIESVSYIEIIVKRFESVRTV
jgi:hypothetical protein